MGSCAISYVDLSLFLRKNSVQAKAGLDKCSIEANGREAVC